MTDPEPEDGDRVPFWVGCVTVILAVIGLCALAWLAAHAVMSWLWGV